MTGVDPCVGILGGLNEDLDDPPAALASALSALNSSLGDKAPPSFVPLSMNINNITSAMFNTYLVSTLKFQFEKK